MKKFKKFCEKFERYCKTKVKNGQKNFKIYSDAIRVNQKSAVS